MTTHDTNSYGDEPYEYYQHLYDPDWSEDGSGATRRRHPVTVNKTHRQIIAGLTDVPSGLEAGFTTTYQPARYEKVWLEDSIRLFYDMDLISDVLAQIKGGKEANVYRCRAKPGLGDELLAAKVYRPRKFRNLRNDKLYREGRSVLTAEGRPVRNNDHRIIRALNKKTPFGAQVSHTSWLMHEFAMLNILHALGAAVPKPIVASENAILMAYLGDERVAAPTLHEATLPPDMAQPLFEEVIRNVELLLQAGYVHGDLSAYNVLFWKGMITLIDFPQIVDAQANSRALAILQRDIQRICQYFSRYGIRTDANDITDNLWRRYQRTSTNDLLADFSRQLEPTGEN